ncbi:MAG: SLC13 family permease [Anaerolineaceae bacterium]|nr:SLC13 family permease [Anaerolineaceae bacterium]
MSASILLTLAILGLAAILFISERLSVDLIALLVLISLTIAKLVTPVEALSGFSNPAVVTVWAVFIISGGLSQTGIANRLGQQVLRFAGSGEVRLIFVIMMTAGLLSAFMNNVGVAALLLPVVIDIAHRTRRSPSRLLMPLASGALLGGLTTLIGTPPNILASDALREAGLTPFSMFDFAPVGLLILLSGILFTILIGRHLLPRRDVIGESINPNNSLEEAYHLGQRLFTLRIPPNGMLNDVLLAESRIGSLLGLNVVAILRNGHTILSPKEDTRLKANDRLLVMGRQEELASFHLRQLFGDARRQPSLADITASGIILAEARPKPTADFLGQNLETVRFRQRYGSNVLALKRNGEVLVRNFQLLPLQAADTLLVQGTQEEIDALKNSNAFVVTPSQSLAAYHLDDSLVFIRLPEDSLLNGRSLRDSRLGDAFGLTVLGIVRQDKSHLRPNPDELLEAGDRLLVQGHKKDIAILRGLEELETDEAFIDPQTLESDRVGLVEVILSPYTTLEGRTLQEIFFREKYGLNVLAIWRRGRPYRHNLREMNLQMGDALLLHGAREKLNLLGQEPDFVVLHPESQPPPKLEKAPLAVLALLAMLVPVITGWLPIAIAAIIGATLMILTGCLTMEEAYRYIDWKAVFLIAGMLPLGLAMQSSGAAQFLAELVVGVGGGLGITAVLIGLFLLTNLASQVMPNPVVTVLMAPIAISTAQDLGASPYSFMMLVAIAASASFLSPVGHPANVLIMGPGGYKFSDYIKVGLPLTAVVLLITMLALPIFWPP